MSLVAVSAHRDSALYRAKADGRNRIELFSMEDSLDPHRRASDVATPAV